MNGYRKKTVFKDTYKRLKKELHYTDKQMYQEFPDICKKIEDEEVANVAVEHELFLAKFFLERKQQ